MSKPKQRDRGNNRSRRQSQVDTSTAAEANAVKTPQATAQNWINFLFIGIPSVIAAIFSAYFLWQTYEKSLPNPQVVDWNISGYNVDERGQVQAVVVQALLTNAGGSAVSLTRLASDIDYYQITPPPPFVALPGICDAASAIETLKETGALVFVDLNDEAPSTCIGADCGSFVPSDKSDVIVYSSHQSQSDGENSLPLTIEPGESKLTPLLFNVNGLGKDCQVTKLSILLTFSDGSIEEIPVLEKFSSE